VLEGRAGLSAGRGGGGEGGKKRSERD
jgi:hypothetical protein